MIKMPKVSIIIPTYNRAESLRSAITSVLNQSFQDFEIIIVDDASKDNTGEVVDAFKDTRIKYIRHEVNKKEAGSRNTGLRNSIGDYIAFLDDDDEWLPDKLRLQVDLLDHSAPTVGVVYTGCFQIERESGKTLIQMTPVKKGYIFKDMIQQNRMLGPSTMLLRKECFEKVGAFDENIDFGTDYDMWLRISKHFHFDYVKDPLVRYYVHNERLSSDTKLMIKGAETMIQKHGRLFASDKKSYSRRYLKLGVYYCYAGNLKKGRQAFWMGIKLYPLETRHYFNLCLTLLGGQNFKTLKAIKDRVVTL